MQEESNVRYMRDLELLKEIEQQGKSSVCFLCFEGRPVNSHIEGKASLNRQKEALEDEGGKLVVLMSGGDNIGRQIENIDKAVIPCLCEKCDNALGGGPEGDYYRKQTIAELRSVDRSTWDFACVHTFRHLILHLQGALEVPNGVWKIFDALRLHLRKALDEPVVDPPPLWMTCLEMPKRVQLAACSLNEPCRPDLLRDFIFRSSFSAISMQTPEGDIVACRFYAFMFVFALSPSLCKGNILLAPCPERMKTFECELCSDSFYYRNSLLEHMADVHDLKRQPFGCLECKERFDTRKGLKDHKRSLGHSGSVKVPPDPILSLVKSLHRGAKKGGGHVVFDSGLFLIPPICKPLEGRRVKITEPTFFVAWHVHFMAGVDCGGCNFVDLDTGANLDENNLERDDFPEDSWEMRLCMTVLKGMIGAHFGHYIKNFKNLRH